MDLETDLSETSRAGKSWGPRNLIVFSSGQPCGGGHRLDPPAPICTGIFPCLELAPNLLDRGRHFDVGRRRWWSTRAVCRSSTAPPRTPLWISGHGCADQRVPVCRQVGGTVRDRPRSPTPLPLNQGLYQERRLLVPVFVPARRPQAGFGQMTNSVQHSRRTTKPGFNDTELEPRPDDHSVHLPTFGDVNCRGAPLNSGIRRKGFVTFAAHTLVLYSLVPY